MAFIDMQNFSRDCVFEMEGKKVIKSSRSKTDESFISLLLPDAEMIA
jgi:hypothetical protein